MDGDRLGEVRSNLAKCRQAGVTLVTISYRMVPDGRDLGVKPPVKVCLDDAVAAIRFIQAHADEWGVDPKRLGLTGGSAGACSSLYAALQNDCELGIKAVFAMSPQTSLDPKETREWIPNATYGGHAFGFTETDAPIALVIPRENQPPLSWNGGPGEAYLRVPASCGRFQVFASGGCGSAFVRAKVYDPDGKLCWDQDDIGCSRWFYSPGQPKAGLWKLTAEKAD